MPTDSFAPPKKKVIQPRFKGLEPQKFAVPNSSTQQIKFRLSGFETMPSFDTTPLPTGTPGEYSSASSRGGLRTSKVPIMPKPGRSIPKFGVDEVAAAIEKTLPPPPPTPASNSASKTLGRGSLLNRFDSAVSSAKAHNKSAVLKNKLQTDMSNQIKSKLGGKGSRSEDPILAREIDSLQKMGAKMDNIMKTWMPEEEIDKRASRGSSFGKLQKDQNRFKPDRKAALLPSRSSGKGSFTRHSDSKLKVISDGFRATLNPFATQDPRELIRTPSNEIIDHLNQRHMESLHQKESTTKKSSPLKAPRSKAKTNMDVPASNDYQGLMDFRTLLEKQSEHQKRLNNPGGRISDHSEYEDASSTPSMISGSELLSSLTESTKNMDAAANIAQRLGTLMSRVASQQASYNKDMTPTNSSTPSPRSRFLPVDELTRRASILKGVAQEAHRSLQDIELHTVGVGGEIPGRGRSPGSILSSTWNKDTATARMNSKEKLLKSVRSTRSGQTDRGISTQTDKFVDQLTKSSSSTGNFEFVKDMSYTDQLMLKKLRGLKASWTEDNIGAEDLEMQDDHEDEPQGTGDQFMSQKTLAAKIASSRKK